MDGVTEKLVSDLVAKRASYKRKITYFFKKVDKDSEKQSIDACKENVLPVLKSIQELDEQISAQYLKFDSQGEEFSKKFENELDGQADYTMMVSQQLKNLEPIIAPPKVPVDKTEVKLFLPNINCPTFSGEGNFHTEYYSFKNQFMNVIGFRTNLADSTKLTYLLSYLKGFALKVVRHLGVTDANYAVALQLLDEEFLNKEALTDDLFKKLIESKPKFDTSYMSTKVYINEMRCLLSDLKNYGSDLLNDDASKKFVAHIIFSKLPNPFRRELVHKVDSNYPSLDDIFSNYVAVFRSLNLSSVKTASFKPNETFKSDVSAGKPALSQNVTTVQNCTPKSPKVNNSNDKRRKCKFCDDSDSQHSSFTCRTFGSHKERVDRCNELGICSLCTSSSHTTQGPH